MRPIVLDPGHGGDDPGAIGFAGTSETDVALVVCLMLREELHALGHEVILTHTGAALRDDKHADLVARAGIATAAGAACLVSIHCNAVEDRRAHGFEVWTTPGETAADPLASTIWLELNREYPEMTGRADESDGDPDKERWLAVLRETPVPAVLVELAFLSNLTEELLLAHPAWQRRAAKAIARAVNGWLIDR